MFGRVVDRLGEQDGLGHFPLGLVVSLAEYLESGIDTDTLFCSRTLHVDPVLAVDGRWHHAMALEHAARSRDSVKRTNP